MCNNHFINFYANNVYHNSSDFLLGVWIGISLITACMRKVLDAERSLENILRDCGTLCIAAFEFISKYGNEIQQF